MMIIVSELVDLIYEYRNAMIKYEINQEMMTKVYRQEYRGDHAILIYLQYPNRRRTASPLLLCRHCGNDDQFGCNWCHNTDSYVI